MSRIAALACAIAAASLVGAVGGSAAPVQASQLFATVGPGFTINLRDASGARVSKLDPGAYVIEVDDLSEEHNFHLTGPGVNRSTEIGDTGKVTWNVTFTDGTYRYVCDPHSGMMNGSFTVGNVAQPPPNPPPGSKSRHVQVEAPAHLGSRLHDHAEDHGGQGREVDEDGHVHRRRARPLADPQRAPRRPGLQPRDEAAHLHGLADMEGEAGAKAGTLRFLCDPHALQGMKGSARSFARPRFAQDRNPRARIRSRETLKAAASRPLRSPTQTERPATRQTGPCVSAFSVSESAFRIAIRPVMPSASMRSKQRRAICGETP